MNPDREFDQIYTWYESKGETQRVNVDSRDGVTCSYPNSGIQVWDLSSGELATTIRPDPPSQIRCIKLSPKKTHLISTYEELAGTWFDGRPQLSRMMNLETGQWTVFDETFFELAINDREQIAASFLINESGVYSNAISIMAFPSLKTLKQISLPPGIHSEQKLLFLPDNHHAIAEFRSYEQKGMWNKWTTTIACLNVEEGEILADRMYEFDNDSPVFADKPTNNELLVYHSWRHSPKTVTAVEIPSLRKIWQTELARVRVVNSGKVSPDGNLVAFLCVPPLDSDLTISPGNYKEPNWDQVPQNELIIVDARTGERIETMVLPAKAGGTFAFAPDGKSAAVGGVGTVHRVDLSGLGGAEAKKQ